MHIGHVSYFYKITPDRGKTENENKAKERHTGESASKVDVASPKRKIPE